MKECESFEVEVEVEASEGPSALEPGDTLRKLLHALDVPGAIDANFAAHLSGQLRDALAELDPRTRGSAFNGRLIAADGELQAGDTTQDPKL